MNSEIFNVILRYYEEYLISLSCGIAVFWFYMCYRYAHIAQLKWFSKSVQDKRFWRGNINKQCEVCSNAK